MLAGAHVADGSGLLAVAGQPCGRQLIERHAFRAAVGHAALAKAGVRADLAAVALRRAAGELERRKLAGWHAYLAGEVRHGIGSVMLEDFAQARGVAKVGFDEREILF